MSQNLQESRDANQSRLVLIIVENHLRHENPAFQKAALNLIKNIRKKDQIYCLEPGFEIDVQPDIERRFLWPTSRETRFNSDKLEEYQILTNFYATGTIISSLQQGKNPIVLCGRAHLHGNFSIPMMLKDYDIKPYILNPN